MAILRIKELRAMSDKELEEKLNELSLELMLLREKIKAGGAVENSGKIREIKRTIARILTIKRERELGTRR